MKVSIVIPNWNGVDKLRKNLPQVLEVKEANEVIVVDDGSTDDSVEFLEKNFPQVKLIILGKNHGFSTAVNKGVEKSTGDLIFLLNTDAVPDKNCIEEARPYFKDEKLFSLSCNTGGSWSWAKFDQGYLWHYMVERVVKVHQTLYASGGSGIFRKSIWEKMGGLDENFNPFYEEDVDLGYRATKRGYLNLWVEKCRVKHAKSSGVIKENFSERQISKVAQRNQLFLIWKNIHQQRLFNKHLFYLSKRLIAHPKYWVVYLSALRKLQDISKKRLVEKSQSKLTDSEILNKFN